MILSNGLRVVVRPSILFWLGGVSLYVGSCNVNANDTRWTQKPFGTLWDRLLEFEYPREDDVVLESWGVGPWQEPGVGGVYRLLLAESSNKINRMYIQWMFETNGKQEIAYSLSIRELNELGEYSIVPSECSLNGSCESSDVIVKHTYEGTSFGVSVHENGLGHYRLAFDYF